MPNGYPWIGRAGTLVQLRSPAPGYSATDLIRGGTHELASGGTVRDRVGTSRRFVLNWPVLTEAEWSTVRTLARLPGPWRYLDPLERNLLTANQSTGTDELRDATGFRAVGQGAVSSDATYAVSGLRSARWDSDTALAATGRGVSLSAAAVDATWAAVRPSVAHSFSVWARASVAVSAQARIEWYSSAGSLISTDTGTAASVSTSGFTQLTCVNKTSPSTAAYAVCGVTNTTTTSAALLLWLDQPQFEEGAAATDWRLGAGTPLVAVESLSPSVALADPAAGLVYHDAELVLLEL
jgi:hypothetical protein